MLFSEPLIKPSGDKAVRITFGDERSLRVNRLVRIMHGFLQDTTLEGVLELVPTYASLTVMYDPGRIDYAVLVSTLIEPARRAMSRDEILTPRRLLGIPVCYEDAYAPDMDYICQYTGLDRDQVVHTHTKEPYYVFQLGFTPGCPFIGPLQEALHVPLMQTPRTHTPQGAVAISVGQTVIYPRATPGGMRVIGRTPVQLFQLDHPDLTLFKPGDAVQFQPVSVDDFRAMEAGAYRLYEGVEVMDHAG